MILLGGRRGLRTAVIPPSGGGGGGGGLPSWRPTVGTIAAISNNTLADVDPDPTNASGYAEGSGQNGMRAWNTSVFVDYDPLGGAFGSIASVNEGGHFDYAGNPYYSFSFDDSGAHSLKWSRRINPVPVADMSVYPNPVTGIPPWPTEFSFDHTWWDWIHPDGHGRIAGSVHTYCGIHPVPAGYGGIVGASGGVALVMQQAVAQSGVIVYSAHVLDLASEIWYRVTMDGSAVTGSTGGAGTCYDPENDRDWIIWFNQAYVSWLKHSINAYETTYCVTGLTTSQPNPIWDSTLHTIITVGPTALAYLNRTSLGDGGWPDGSYPGWVVANMTGDTWSFGQPGSDGSSHMGLQYVGVLDKYVAYSIYDPTNLYWITRPSDPTHDWVVERETLTGTTPTFESGWHDATHYFDCAKRFAWMPASKCFSLNHGNHKPVWAMASSKVPS